MEELLKIMKSKFGDEILDIDESADEILIHFEECDVKIKEDKKIDIYRRFIYADDDEQELISNTEEECIRYRTILLKEFKIKPEIYDDSCMGCPAVDEIVGYFNNEFDIEFITKFIYII